MAKDVHPNPLSDAFRVKHEKSAAGRKRACAQKKANAGVGDDADVAAYLARVPKPYKPLDDEDSEELK